MFVQKELACSRDARVNATRSVIQKKRLVLWIREAVMGSLVVLSRFAARVT